MKKDCKRRGVSGENDYLRDTSVEGFSCFIGALFDLAIVGGLLDYVQDFLRTASATGQAGK
jgi:hypothetical protein